MTTSEPEGSRDRPGDTGDASRGSGAAAHPPADAQPTSAQPTSAQPTSAQPTSAQPTSAQPAPAQPAPAQPAPTQPPPARSAPEVVADRAADRGGTGRRGGVRTAGVRVVGVVVVVAGLVLVLAGAATYAVVTKTLGDQKITVSDDAAHFAGQHVNTPWEAYAQADVIAQHAEEIAGGKTYAELPQDDPKRSTVMTASFLQASLFTSVVAFGVAALVVGLGVVLVLVGFALLRLARAVRVPA